MLARYFASGYNELLTIINQFSANVIFDNPELIKKHKVSNIGIKSEGLLMFTRANERGHWPKL